MTPWTAAAIAVGVPLAFDPGGYFIFLPLKWTLAAVLVAAGLAALLLERRPLAWSRALAPWGALLLVFVATSAGASATSATATTAASAAHHCLLHHRLLHQRHRLRHLRRRHGVRWHGNASCRA